MWFIPVLLLGLIAVAASRRSTREAISPTRQLPPPPRGMPQLSAPSGPLGPPGPLSVLGEILRGGKTPPPTVVLCAIAEAQSIGRNDLASDIVQAFVVPVVYQHQKLRAQRANCERGSYSCAPRYAPAAPPLETIVIPATPPHAPAPAPVPTPAAAPAAASEPQRAPLPMLPMPSTEDAIDALLNADPRRFMELVSRGGTFPGTTVPQVVPTSAPPAPSPPPTPIAQPTGLPTETVAQMQEAAGLHEAADQTRAMSPGSPIPGVPDFAWRNFVARLSRESPQFASSRHVGQYRQRRERLVELGIDPTAIAGSAQAQRVALDADLADAHHHATAGDVFAKHLGRPIILPGREDTETVTLSGVLGVIQCAGLDGAVGWLERSNDRKRYPHTTQTFMHTNNVF